MIFTTSGCWSMNMKNPNTQVVHRNDVIICTSPPISNLCYCTIYDWACQAFDTSTTVCDTPTGEALLGQAMGLGLETSQWCFIIRAISIHIFMNWEYQTFDTPPTRCETPTGEAILGQ